MKHLFGFLDGAQRWVLQPLFVIVILVGGFVGAAQLSKRRVLPQQSEAVTYAPLVRVASVQQGPHRVLVRGNGTLAARTRIGLVPQVSGEVIAIHAELRAGGRFRVGDVLLAIEPRDYELAVARSEADVAAATTVLAKVDAEAASARGEWSALHPERPAPPLVALEPQVAEAAARLAAAEAALAKARLDLARTQIVARFDGRVVSASVDVGQVVAANQRIGEVYGSEVLQVAIPLAAEELRWIRLPGEPGSETPTRVELSAEVDGRVVHLNGRVARLEAELAEGTRLARVVVELGAATVPPELALRLLPGLFVEATFEGAPLSDVVSIPRTALREGGVVWGIEEGRIAFKTPEVVHSDSGRVLVRGLAADARVVTSDLDVVTDGMHARTASEGGAR